MENKSIYREALEVLVAVEEARRILLGRELGGRTKAQDLSLDQREIFLKKFFSVFGRKTSRNRKFFRGRGNFSSR